MFELAESVGRLLAENGLTLANGGYGGTMLAAAKGVVDPRGILNPGVLIGRQGGVLAGSEE